MKPYESDLIEDVEELVEKAVLEEVTVAVWKTFEQALAKLDPESRALLESHLNGSTTSELSRERNLPEPEMEKWLQQIKRQLQRSVRQGLQVRQ